MAQTKKPKRPAKPKGTAPPIPPQPTGNRLRSPFDWGRPGGFDYWFGPFLLPLVILPFLGYVLHVAGGKPPQVLWVPAMILVLAGLLAWLGFHQAHPRRLLLRMHISVSLIFAIGSLAIHEIIGPGNTAYGHLWPWVWIVVGCAWGVSWVVPRFDSLHGNGDDDHGNESGLDEMLGVPGAKAKQTDTTENRENWRVKMSGGQDSEDLQGTTRTMAALRHLPRGAVRVLHTKWADVAEVIMMLKDPLADDIPYPGPSNSGGSIADPLRTGRYEDGSDEEYQIFGYSKPGNNLAAPGVGATAGSPNAGKTKGAQVTAAEVLSRCDVEMWWADPVKGPQSVQPLLAGLDWFVGTLAGCHAMLAAVDRLIPVRANYLGSYCRIHGAYSDPHCCDSLPEDKRQRGLEQWEKGCGLRALYVNLEEASRVLPDSEYFVQLTQAVRSVGIFVNTSQQRPSGNVFDTDARHNVGLTRCYGTGDEHAAKMILPDEVLDAGIRPDAWGRDFPGRHVMTAPSIPHEKWTMVAKDFLITTAQLAGIVESHLHLRADLRPEEIVVLGDIYANRRRYREVAPTAPDLRGDGSGVVDMAAPEVPAPDDDDEDVIPMPARPADIAEGMDDIDPREPIDTEGLDDIDMSDGVYTSSESALTPVETDSAFMEMIAEILEQRSRGGEPVEVTTAELVERWFKIPGVTSRSGLPRRITKMVRVHAAIRTSHGVYSIDPDAVAIMAVSSPDSGGDDDEG